MDFSFSPSRVFSDEDVKKMLDFKGDFWAEFLMLSTGIGATWIVAHIEVLGIAVAAVVTFLSSWWYRHRKHMREISLIDEKHKYEVEQMKLKIRQMEQEIRQDEDRHKNEMMLMQRAYDEKNKREKPPTN